MENNYIPTLQNEIDILIPLSQKDIDILINYLDRIDWFYEARNNKIPTKGEINIMDNETTNETVNEVLNKKNRIIKKLKKKNRKLNNLINYLLEYVGCIVDTNYCDKYKNCITCIYKYTIKKEKHNDK